LLLRLQYKRPDEPPHFPALASFPYRHNPPQTAENLKEKTPPKICSTLKPGTLNPSPFSRKTDRTESQKPPSRKFSYPFVYNDLSRFHARLRPPISIKNADRSKHEGRLLFAPGKERPNEHENARDARHRLRLV